MASPARVVNRTLAVLASLVILTGLAVGLWGDHANAPSSSDTAATTSVPLTTLPGLTGSRPANTDGSWFTTSTSAEQYDYPMSQLSCSQLQQYLTTDLCAIAHTIHGSMMFVATEGYWDPKEPDTDGVVRIPLYFQVFTHTKIGGPARATSVLDGELTVDYAITDNRADTVTVQLAKVAGQETILVQLDALYGSTAVQHVQILSMSATGAPTLVAAYEGGSMKIAATDSSLLVSAHRYGPPSGTKCCDDYATVWTLAPTTNGASWTAIEQSHADTQQVFANTTPPVIIGNYTFPQKFGTSTGA